MLFIDSQENNIQCFEWDHQAVLKDVLEILRYPKMSIILFLNQMIKLYGIITFHQKLTS